MMIALYRNFVCPVPDVRLEDGASSRWQTAMTMTNVEIGHARATRSRAGGR